jgi:hypothetical protein
MPANRFFPATCHPRLPRRQFVAASAGALAVAALGGRSARASAAPPDASAATQNASAAPQIIQAHATLPADPWAVAHGLRAMGPSFTIQGGQRAVDFLLEKHLTEIAVNGRTALGFPRSVEFHANSFLKTMLEAGVPLDYRFTYQGKGRTLADLVEGARLLFRSSQLSAPNELPWSLIAFSRTTSPVRRRWTNAWGEPVDLDALVEGGLRDLENASAPVAVAMRAGQPMAAKAPVHGFTCGGTHMLYGLLSAVRYGFGRSDARARVQQQTALMLWRMGGADVDLIDRFYRVRPRTAFNEWEHLDARLKILGHAEECVAFATAHKVVTLSAPQPAQRAAGVQVLKRLLDDLRQRDLAAARAQLPQTYQQLVGDACHAQHGLTLT